MVFILKFLKVALLMTLIFLAACDGFKVNSTRTDSLLNDKVSEAGEENGKVILDFWTFWGSEDRRPVIDNIIDDFNQSQDEIEIHHTNVPRHDFCTKNLASIAE